MRTILRPATALLILLLHFEILTAQQTGEIRGKVAEAKGEALPGVAVTAKSPNLQGLRTAVSDKDGNFRLPLLPVGTYSLAFDLQGFEKVTMTGTDVRLGFTASLSVVLNPTAVREEVTVVAPNPPIDKTKVDTSYRLNSGDLAFSTAQARTIAEIVDLTPGVTGVRANMVTGGGKSRLGTRYDSRIGTSELQGRGRRRE